MSLEDDIRNLARIPLFAEVEPEALRLVAFSAETKILRTGEYLFLRGDPSDGGYVVMSGSFSLDRSLDRDGNRSQIVGPCALIGELALMTQTERPVSACAREPATVLKISRLLFQRVLREFPHSALRVRASLESRLVSFTRSLGVSDPGGERFVKL